MFSVKSNLWAKIQTFLLVLAFLFPFLLKKLNIQITCKGESDWFVIDVSNAGLPTWVMLTVTGLILSGMLCHFFRQENKDMVFNCGNDYKKSPFLWYKFCSAILGYRECNLMGVPLASIARLVIDDTFLNYNYGEINELKESDTIRVIDSWERDLKPNAGTREINLIVMDTYEIKRSAVDSIMQNKPMPTLIVSRERVGKEGRWYVPQFASIIWKQLNELEKEQRKQIKKVNFYTTANPRNMKDIVEKVFRTYGRGNVKTLVVYQQNDTEERLFEKKGVKIKL